MTGFYSALDKLHVSITRASQNPAMSTSKSESISLSGATAATSSMPTQLSRELSQQELDAAQQLIEHSQSIPRRHSPESARGSEQPQDARRGGDENGNGVASHEHHDLSDSLNSVYQRPSPYPTAPAVQNMTPPQRVASSNETLPVGQMCRYE